jgi:hypothetical protein
VQFVGIPSDTIEHVALGVWLVSGSATSYRVRFQQLLATHGDLGTIGLTDTHFKRTAHRKAPLRIW